MTGVKSFFSLVSTVLRPPVVIWIRGSCSQGAGGLAPGSPCGSCFQQSHGCLNLQLQWFRWSQLHCHPLYTSLWASAFGLPLLFVCLFSGNFLSLKPEGAVSSVNNLPDRSAFMEKTPKSQGRQVVPPRFSCWSVIDAIACISPLALPDPC